MTGWRQSAQRLSTAVWTAAARAGLRVADGALQWHPSAQESPRLTGTRSWFDANHMSGAYLPLELREGDRVHAWMAVREIAAPGVFRRWLLLCEPHFAVDSPVNQGQALAALVAMARANRVDTVRCRSIFADWTGPDLSSLADLEGVEVEHEDVGSYLLDLSASPDAWIANLHSKHRYAFRRGVRDGVAVHPAVEATTFISLMETTYQRGGKSNPFKAAYLRQLIEAPRVPTCVASATVDDAVQAAVIVAHDANQAWFIHGVSIDHPATGASVLCHLEIMTQLKARGVTTYDLGGAVENDEDPRIAGITRFKSRFGAPFRPRQRFTLELSGGERMLGKALGLSRWR